MKEAEAHQSKAHRNGRGGLGPSAKGLAPGPEPWKSGSPGRLSARSATARSECHAHGHAPGPTCWDCPCALLLSAAAARVPRMGEAPAPLRARSRVQSRMNEVHSSHNSAPWVPRKCPRFNPLGQRRFSGDATCSKHSSLWPRGPQPARWRGSASLRVGAHGEWWVVDRGA